MKKLSIVLLLNLVLGGAQAEAQDFLDWRGTNGTNWFLASNWDIAGPGANHVPTQNDFAVILAMTPTPLINTGQTASARGLTINAGATLSHLNGALNVAAVNISNGLVVNGTYHLGLGSPNVPTLNVHGRLDVNPGGLFRNDRGTHTQANNTLFQIGGTYQLFSTNATLVAKNITLMGSGRLEYLGGTFSSTGIVLNDTSLFEIGSMVTADVTGAYTQSSASTLKINFDSSTFNSDQLSVSGTATLAGNLDLGSYTSGSVGDTVTLIDAGNLQGEFDSIFNVAIVGTSNLGWSLDYGVNDNLDAEIRLLGDANGDQLVNGQDLSILAANFGSTATAGVFEDADFNGDGTVNGVDLAILSANFGASASAFAVTVPEPGSLLLIGLGSFAVIRRRH